MFTRPEAFTMSVFLTMVCVILLGSLGLWRGLDIRADQVERARLLDFQPHAPALFDPAMVADLPDAARRYFSFSIATGTPLYTVADLAMTGQFSLGTKDAPNYLEMTATQTLAAPHGFIWRMSATRGLMHVSGSDSGKWTRFWLMGLAPVARIGGTRDHTRAAFGRFAAEAVFWTPAALLPGPGITWAAVDASTARVTISDGDLMQAVDMTVDAQGRPVTVQFQRWSNANADKTYRLQPFGGQLSDYRTFAGFTVPSHVEAGNHFGTDAYFQFFIADISGVRFPASD
jgi:hypothetical protein